jgi:hypothetical protein
MTPAQITHIRRLACSMVTELAQITGALDTIEEIHRNPDPATGERDAVAIAEAQAGAQDAAIQLSVTAEEIFPLLAVSKFANTRRKLIPA